MSSLSANMLRVYGKPDRAEWVREVVEAIFGPATIEVPVRATAWGTPGCLLAAARFDLPAAPPAQWVKDLSNKMSREIFDLTSEYPKGSSVCRRETFSGGSISDEEDQVREVSASGLNLPAGEPAVVQLKVPLEGPLDLAAIAEAHLAMGYICWFPKLGGDEYHETDIFERNTHLRACESLSTLLSDAEKGRITLAKARLKVQAERVRAGAKACEALTDSIQSFFSKDVAALLEPDERASLAHVREICDRLMYANIMIGIDGAA